MANETNMQMDADERARWEQFRQEAIASARKLRAIDRDHVDGKLDESIHDGLLEAADLLEIFGQPIEVLTPTEPQPSISAVVETLETLIREWRNMANAQAMFSGDGPRVAAKCLYRCADDLASALQQLPGVPAERK